MIGLTLPSKTSFYNVNALIVSENKAIIKKLSKLVEKNFKNVFLLKPSENHEADLKMLALTNPDIAFFDINYKYNVNDIINNISAGTNVILIGTNKSPILNALKDLPLDYLPKSINGEELKNIVDKVFIKK